MTPAKKLRVAVISTWLPRESGISTFAGDFTAAVRGVDPKINFSVFAIDELTLPRRYGKAVAGVIRQNNQASYLQAADEINRGGFDVVVLQHEFGIFGPAPDGRHIFALLKRLEVPVVTIMHTAALVPRSRRRTKRLPLIRRLITLSERTIVTSQLTADTLVSTLNAPAEKLSVVHHGSPEIPRLPVKTRQALRHRLGWDGRRTILCFGLIRPGKGIEYALQALRRLVRQYPDMQLVIAGRIGPGSPANQRYYDDLKRRTKQYGLDANVSFITRFVSNATLTTLFQAADFVVTPYTRLEQASSGVLGWAMATGLVVVSTPYWYAREVLADGRGVIVPPRDPKALASAFAGLLKAPARVRSIATAARSYSQRTAWPKAGKAYAQSIRSVASRRLS